MVLYLAPMLIHKPEYSIIVLLGIASSTWVGILTSIFIDPNPQWNYDALPRPYVARKIQAGNQVPKLETDLPMKDRRVETWSCDVLKDSQSKRNKDAAGLKFGPAMY